MEESLDGILSVELGRTHFLQLQGKWGPSLIHSATLPPVEIAILNWDPIPTTHLCRTRQRSGAGSWPGEDQVEICVEAGEEQEGVAAAAATGQVAGIKFVLNYASFEA